jgi:hypothetical protein
MKMSIFYWEIVEFASDAAVDVALSLVPLSLVHGTSKSHRSDPLDPAVGK